VPETNTFTGFTTTGEEVFQLAQMNYQRINNGFYFFTDATKTKTIHFPAIGSRETYGYGGVNNASIIGTTYNLGTSYTAVKVGNAQVGFLWAGTSSPDCWVLGSNLSSRALGMRPVADY
jgi:hypothetical protein